jgi:hypothetical protein
VTAETSSTEPRLASFGELRELAKATEGIRRWISARSSATAATGWRVDGPGARDAERLFRQPSPDWPGFAGWLGRIAEDLIIADASAVCLRSPAVIPSAASDVRLRDGGGSLSLDLIDPATVEPAIDRYGRLLGWAQYSGEVPRRYFTEIIGGPPAGIAPVIGFLPRGLAYLSLTRRPWAPWGCSPLEQAIVRKPDGSVDLEATEARLTRTAGDGWAAACKAHLARALFGPLLERVAPGSLWKWDPDG